jgi:general stress protein YciG
MVDSENTGQFGEQRDDTKEQASKGGQASSGSFGAENGADPSEAQAQQPREVQVEGGEKGGQQSQSDSDEDES